MSAAPDEKQHGEQPAEPSAGEFCGPVDAGVFDRNAADEATEYLRLAQSEGENPLYDALVGRVAQEELDNLIEGGNRREAAVAKRIRANLVERINRLAPVK